MYQYDQNESFSHSQYIDPLLASPQKKRDYAEHNGYADRNGYSDHNGYQGKVYDVTSYLSAEPPIYETQHSTQHRTSRLNVFESPKMNGVPPLDRVPPLESDEDFLDFLDRAPPLEPGSSDNTEPDNHHTERELASLYIRSPSPTLADTSPPAEPSPPPPDKKSLECDLTASPLTPDKKSDLCDLSASPPTPDKKSDLCDLSGSSLEKRFPATFRKLKYERAQMSATTSDSTTAGLSPQVKSETSVTRQRQTYDPYPVDATPYPSNPVADILPYPDAIPTNPPSKKRGRPVADAYSTNASPKKRARTSKSVQPRKKKTKKEIDNQEKRQYVLAFEALCELPNKKGSVKQITRHMNMPAHEERRVRAALRTLVLKECVRLIGTLKGDERVENVFQIIKDLPPSPSRGLRGDTAGKLVSALRELGTATILQLAAKTNKSRSAVQWMCLRLRKTGKFRVMGKSGKPPANLYTLAGDVGDDISEPSPDIKPKVEAGVERRYEHDTEPQPPLPPQGYEPVVKAEYPDERRTYQQSSYGTPRERERPSYTHTSYTGPPVPPGFSRPTYAPTPERRTNYSHSFESCLAPPLPRDEHPARGNVLLGPQRGIKAEPDGRLNESKVFVDFLCLNCRIVYKELSSESSARRGTGFCRECGSRRISDSGYITDGWRTLHVSMS